MMLIIFYYIICYANCANTKQTLIGALMWALLGPFGELIPYLIIEAFPIKNSLCKQPCVCCYLQQNKQSRVAAWIWRPKGYIASHGGFFSAFQQGLLAISIALASHGSL